MKLSEVLVPAHDFLFGLEGGVQYEGTLQADGDGFRLIGHRVAYSSDPEEPAGSSAQAVLVISGHQLQDNLAVELLPLTGWSRVDITGSLLGSLPTRQIYFRPKEQS